MTQDIDLSAALIASFAARATSPVLHYAEAWRDWRWLGAACDALADAFGDTALVGLVARPRPHHVAVIAANVRDRRTTAFIYSAQRTSGIAADIERLRFPVIVADRQDWDETTLEAARRAGSIAIATDEREGGGVEVLAVNRGGAAATGSDTAFLLLSSGTTGPPKRLPLSWQTASALVANSRAAYVGSDDQSVPQIMAAPLGNVSGLVYTLPPLVFGGRLVLLDRFEPSGWAAAVREHRPMRGAMTPTGVRMVLDADIPRDWLSSLKVIGVGGSRLDEQLQIEFEQKYGVPVLPAFGATEFGGVIANWSLDGYRKWGEAKRGSVGRAMAGIALRVVDSEKGNALEPGQQGLLEAKVDRVGPDWIRTTDIVSIDADGFLFIHGRADGAINRGGFKVLPDVVANTIRQHPAIADAAVVGIQDARLGELPVAAIELKAGAQLVEPELREWLKERLVAYQVPAIYRFVEHLPRNASMKISLLDVKTLFEASMLLAN